MISNEEGQREEFMRAHARASTQDKEQQFPFQWKSISEAGV